MSNIQKTIIVFPSAIVIALFFYFISAISNVADKSEPSQEVSTASNETTAVIETNNMANSNTVTSRNDSVQIPVEDKVLTLSSIRCRGCGECTLLDPEHFEMNGREAVVISQDNSLSSKLQSAIDSCPAQAIKLT